MLGSTSQSPSALLPDQPLEGHVVLENPLRRYKSSCHSEIASVHCEKILISGHLFTRVLFTCMFFLIVLLLALTPCTPLPPVES